MTPEENKPETSANETAEKGVLSRLWRSKAMTPLRAAFWAASPVWWPAKQAVKASLWGLQRESTAMKVLTPTFAATALAAYLGALSYGTLYATVASGDYYWFGQPYSEGERVGTIADLSIKGKFPCDTVEGQLAMPNLGTGGSSTFAFSVRRLYPGVIEQLQKAYDEGTPVSLAFKQSHWPKERFDPEAEGWFFPNPITSFECIQKTDFNIVAVTPRPGMNLPTPPRLRPGG